jgi:two-component system sensor histidine kinase/response regulator
MKHTILCVDDEIDNVEALERIFRSKYKVLKATSGAQALSLLDQYPEPLALIITDQRMPQMTGVEFLSRTLTTHPDTVRILLTGYTDMESIISAVNSGQIYRYLNKPWDPVDLTNTVERAVERFEMQIELKLKNAELSKALSELQVLDQAKSQFMILINHELKTPLTSILSFSELLKETLLTEEQDLCLSRIERGANRLKDLIDDVLLIVSAEAKTLKPKVSPFDSSSLLTSIGPHLESSLKSKGQKIARNITDKKVVGDQALLQQVLERILHNASKFGKENSPISLEAQLSQPHRLTFKISNQGPQISPSVADKILKPFFLDEDVMNHSVGMGLGLTLCQAILKSHGSQLQIENTLGGVEVFFEVPCL